MESRERLNAKSYSRAVFVLLMFAFGVRVMAAVYWQEKLERANTTFQFGDSQSYWILARTIADGTPYQYGGPDAKIFRAPLYPIFLSPFTSLLPTGQGEGYWATLAARIAGAALGTLSIWLLGQIAKSAAGYSASVFTIALGAVYPGAIGMSIFILSEAVFVPLMCISLYALFQTVERFQHTSKVRLLGWVPYERNYFDIAMAGMTSGLACLSRPSWSLWGGVVLFVLLAKAKQVGNLKYSIQLWLVFAFSLILVMFPWWIRNYRITGKFVPTTLQVGSSLYDGLHPGATGSSDEGMAFVDSFLRIQKQEDQSAQAASLESTMEWRVDERMKKAALEWVASNPTEAIRLGGMKWIKTWTPFPVAKELGSNWIRVAEGGMYLLIMLLGLVGLYSKRKSISAWLFVIPCFYFGILHMIFIGSVRYRQPAVFVLCVLAGIGAIAAWNQWTGSRSSNRVEN